MKKFFNAYVIAGIILLIVFNVLTVLLAFVDKQVIGFSEVGLAALNKLFLVHKYNKMWDTLSDVILYISFGFVLGMAIYGLKQLIERKSLFKVDFDILAFGVGIIVIFIVWLVFDHLWIVNTRPIAKDASYPSTHIMFSTFVLLASCASITKRNNENKKYCFLGFTGMSVLVCLSFLGRILSKMHFMTDALGGLFLGISVFLMVYGVSLFLTKKYNSQQEGK